MNGIVSEAIYPKISRDCDGIPIRSFYFDGTQKALHRELGIYMELVRSYRDRRMAKAVPRTQGERNPLSQAPLPDFVEDMA
jgi:hypothetical protein